MRLEFKVLHTVDILHFDPTGFICGGEKVDLAISFTPQEYCTAQMQFQILISEFNAKPLICSVTGTSIPGLTKE